MGRFKEKIIELEKYLKTINAPVLNYLNKGVEEINIDCLKLNDAIVLPKDIIDIFKWHNGTNIDYNLFSENFYMFPTFILNSFDDIKALYKTGTFEFEKKNMLPLFSSGNGEYRYCPNWSFLKA